MDFIDEGLLSTMAGLGGGGAFVFAIGTGIYTIFNEELSPEAAITISIMSAALFVALVLTADNRRKIKNINGENK
jgi:hypothetical protein